MQVSISLRGPKKVLAVVEEVEIVSHVYPTGISLGEYMCSFPGLAIREIQIQLGLDARHGLQTQPASIGQPLRAYDVFEWLVCYLNPGGVVASQLGYSESDARIRAACSRVTLSDNTR